VTVYLPIISYNATFHEVPHPGIIYHNQQWDFQIPYQTFDSVITYLYRTFHAKYNECYQAIWRLSIFSCAGHFADVAYCPIWSFIICYVAITAYCITGIEHDHLLRNMNTPRLKVIKLSMETGLKSQASDWLKWRPVDR
jgi:hypothetical protein